MRVKVGKVKKEGMSEKQLKKELKRRKHAPNKESKTPSHNADI